MLHGMVMQKFNLEANAVINLSFKLSSFDFAVDITNDAEYSQQSEVQKGKIFDNKESLILAVRLKALSKVTHIKTDDNGVFEMLFIAIGTSICTFLNYLRPMLMINVAHLNGLYKGTNLVAVAMDENNRIVPIAFGIRKREIGPCWSWWMSVLKECIGDNPNLLFISDRHAAIALAVEKEFPLAFHAPDAHEKLCRAGPQRCKQSGKKRIKSMTWVVNGVNAYQYEVFDGQYIREVSLQTGICGCRKWKLSGLPRGHVIAITWFLGLTDCVHYAADWFKKPKYQATYSESIHSLGNMQQWEFPKNFQKAIPPRMDNPQSGRPKNTNRIQSQGEEPRIIRCTRCTQTGHRRDQCGQPFVV
uniref:Transposase, MuDR, MULE transposase domain protein n=1 Tax=Tanacetum cinerariifolium TaxID=118510 RepID=A0A6L2KPT3_TANCI|nr:transposase, MuDR, MULE transposase domain protein [Tanacetum cinerariifolium]